MKYTEAQKGRVFILRLEDGEIIHEVIEKFAKEKKVKSAIVSVIGGVDKGSKLVVGPEEGRAEKINPMELVLDDVYETVGVGTIFPNTSGVPVLHMHISCGRKDKSITGCVRRGVKVWHVLEVIIQEITNCESKRILEENTGFELLQP